MNDMPPIIKDVGFDFHWSEEKVWALAVPVSTMDIRELSGHFNIPFLDAGDKRYVLTPRVVMEHAEQHPDEYART